MSHPGVSVACALCGEDLELAPTELALIEGYELAFSDVTRTDEDDLEDQEEEYREPDSSEFYVPFCSDCAPKVKFGIERWLMKRVQAIQKARDAGLEDAEDADA